MKNFKITISLFSLVFFLQGCDPSSQRTFDLVPSDTYKPIQSNTAFKSDLGSSMQIIKCLATKEGFNEYNLPSEFDIKYYQRHCKTGTQSIYISYIEDRDVIWITVIERPNLKFSQNSWDICEELIKQFRIKFGNDRIKTID